MTTGANELAKRVSELPWYHRIALPNGVMTPGVVNVERVLPRLALPSSLDGKSVLDVGAWDGFYSFETACRGAARVVATDSFSWDGRGWGSKASFTLAREALNLADAVEDMLIDPMELSPERLGGRFDIVLYLGVLYHLRDPVTALERASDCCADLLVLETETALNWLPYPAARFYPETELNEDSTNWYQYNIRALKRLLYEVGFRSVAVEYRHPFYRRLGRATLEKRAGRSFRAVVRSSRVVIHARK